MKFIAMTQGSKKGKKSKKSSKGRVLRGSLVATAILVAGTVGAKIWGDHR